MCILHGVIIGLSLHFFACKLSCKIFMLNYICGLPMKMYLYEHLTYENFIQKFPDLWYTTTNTHARDKCACFSSIVGHHPTLCVYVCAA